jgi:hypothetical protein
MGESMSEHKAYLCMAEPGAADVCKHLRNLYECVSPNRGCEYKPWPKRRSFWCWIRRHRMYVAGYKYHYDDDGHQGDIDTIKVCQCKLNDTGVPTFVEQLRRA